MKKAMLIEVKNRKTGSIYRFISYDINSLHSNGVLCISHSAITLVKGMNTTKSQAQGHL